MYVGPPVIILNGNNEECVIIFRGQFNVRLYFPVEGERIVYKDLLNLLTHCAGGLFLALFVREVIISEHKMIVPRFRIGEKRINGKDRPAAVFAKYSRER